MLKISNSVGRGGANVDSDVVIVKTLLNRHIVPPAELLKINGTVNLKTVNAILAFQHRLGMVKCDGRVDPGRRTFRALRTFPKSVPVTQTHQFSYSEIPKVLGGWVTNGPIGSLVDNVRQKIVKSYGRGPLNSQSTRTPPPILRPAGSNAIAWGAKVSPEFKKRVIEICKELEINPDYLMACMAFESMETFSPKKENKLSKAIGLIQFTKPAIEMIGTTREKLAKMTAIEQLEYVRKYFLPKKGKLRSLEDIYMVILCPAAVGKGPDGIVYKKDKRPIKYYEQNKGLDKNPRDGVITVSECSVVLNAAYKKGLSKGYFG